jgi:hypothetical protein
VAEVPPWSSQQLNGETRRHLDTNWTVSKFDLLYIYSVYGVGGSKKRRAEVLESLVASTRVDTAAVPLRFG